MIVDAKPGSVSVGAKQYVIWSSGTPSAERIPAIIVTKSVYSVSVMPMPVCAVIMSGPVYAFVVQLYASPMKAARLALKALTDSSPSATSGAKKSANSGSVAAASVIWLATSGTAEPYVEQMSTVHMSVSVSVSVSVS